MKLLVFALVAYVSTQADQPPKPNAPPIPVNPQTPTTSPGPTSKSSINPTQAQAPQSTNAVAKTTTPPSPVLPTNGPNKTVQEPSTASPTSPLKTVTNEPPSAGVPTLSTQALPKDGKNVPVQTITLPPNSSTQADIKVKPTKTSQGTILPTATNDSANGTPPEGRGSSSITSTEEVNDLLDTIGDHGTQLPPVETPANEQNVTPSKEK
ncbi:hypothetical protein DSO57_1034130 [Entomophthora muscae]|uniref:Uncharacterized protein n=1 Tax=Entomophthora muscae TaxID=34485 RepID=A0ACC2SZY5_9FUNG|nr:hypothetical protein DSO57_1034130 [Entomophthora muscae]